ncbi:TonB-dependent receptor [Caldimonas caldifontis]|uniref:TonB-dependent receptor n=1 Tax=Caldimonas caldifontis TaxID=1452508 RepID=UPI0011B0E1CB|nr:TonB-dependent receptor [Caldimonas caldifontis]
MRTLALSAAALAAAAPCSLALAQGVATDTSLAPVVVTGQRAELDPTLPQTTASKTAEQLRDQNLVNPEDALRYLPATTIRKRYIGDRNALIGGRNFGTLQPSRALVYVDGYLLSNFLGRFDAPRWNMLTPESIERVDMLYGPYSALYPGNSIGTTVVVHERVPQGFEASARLGGHRQQFSAYGDSGHYDGHQFSARIASRLDSGLWYALHLNHQDSTSQPMQYHTSTTLTPGTAGTPVTGIRYDTDPLGRPRAVFGANSGAIDRTQQDTIKLQVGQDLTPTLQASAFVGYWVNDSVTRNRTFLRDVNGNPVWSGTVTDGTYQYTIPTTAFAPSQRDEAHWQSGFTVKTRHATGWNGSLVASLYRIGRDDARQASQPDPVAALGGPGTLTRRDGTGWHTMEAQAAYTPTPGDFGDGHHALTFGLHRNGYRLDQTVDNVSDWRSGGGTRAQYYRGRTEITAAYAQDVWTLREDLQLTLGLRVERFRAHDGEQLTSNGVTTVYGERSLNGRSPKASLAWWATPEWLLKASAGHGVRFPNVEELYNGTATGTSVIVSDPNLRPERSTAVELSAEHSGVAHRLRVSLFQDVVKDAILRQSDTTVVPSVTRVSNVDRVRTRGIEFVGMQQNVFVRGLDLEGHLAFTRSIVTANTRDPGSVGAYWLRVPKSRGALLAAWRPNDLWRTSLGLRYSGRAYNDVYNLDVQPDVYGGVSRVTQLDWRASVKLQPQLEWAVGIDNLTDQRAWQSHPYPGRTLHTELRWTQ